MSKAFRIASLCILAALGWSSATVAGTTPKRPPAAAGPSQPEPTTFMGVRFGVPVAEQFVDCSRPESGDPDFDRKVLLKWDLARQRVTCFSRLGKFAELNIWPDLGLRVLGVTLNLAEADSVEGLSVKVYRFDWMKMLDLLTAKFGEPQAHEVVSYSNLAGGQRDGGVYTWKWPGVTISLSEYGSKVDESLVRVETARLVRWLKRQSMQNAQENKDKL